MIDDALEMNAEASMQQEREDRLKQHTFMEEKSNKLEPLFEACEQGNATELRSLLSIMSQEEKDEALTLNYMSGTTIGILYEMGFIGGANEDLRENSGLKFFGKTLLSLAVVNDRLECVKFLLEMNAQVNAKVKDVELSDTTVMHLAILPKGKSPSEIRKGIFELLLDKATDINEADGDGLTPIHLAVKECQKEFFNMLAVKDADVNKADLKHRTPLHTAVYDRTGDLMSMLKLLLDNGAKLDKNDPERCPILHALVIAGRTEEVKKVVKNGEDINGCNLKGETPAYIAIRNNIDDQENPCLDLLVNDYHAIYLSRHSASLTDRESLIRAVIFICLGAAIFGGCYGYLVVGHNTSTSCITAYNGMLLPPYLFIFVSTIFFKVVQYIFEVMVIPALDFLGFVTGFTSAMASLFKTCGSNYACAAAAAKSCCHLCCACCLRFCRNSAPTVSEDVNVSASRKIDLDTTYRDSIPSATSKVVNPMQRDGPGRDVELGKVQDKNDISAVVASTCARLSIAEGFSVPSTSLLLYKVFGEINVKNWRLNKYTSAYRTNERSKPDYYESDFSHTPYLFLYLQFIWGYVSFIIAAIRVDGSLSAWEQYTDFFATIVHSGIPTTFLSCLKMALYDGRFDQMMKNKLLKMLSPILMLLALPFWTHSGPVSILYWWLVYPFTVILYFALDKFRSLKEKEAEGYNHVFMHVLEFVLEVTGRFYCIFAVQTMFNYASMFYALPMPISPQDYMSVISQDWALRTQTQCFLNEALKSSRGVVALFSWL